MEREIPNPYESPKSSQCDGVVNVTTNSLLRGLAIAIPLSVVGFAIPQASGLVFAMVEQMNSPYATPPALDFISLFKTYLNAAIGCAILFALAGILNYSPAIRLGLVRSLLFVGLSMFSGLFFMSVMTLTFNLESQSYTSDPWLWLRVFLALSVPIAYTVIHTRQRFSLQSNVKPVIAQNDG